MKWMIHCLSLIGIGLSVVGHAEAGSTFEFVLETAVTGGLTAGTVSADLVLREVFDGVGDEVLDMSDGPGLFSFSLTLAQSSSTSGVPATIQAVTLNSALGSAVSNVNFLGVGPHAVELNGAISLTPTPSSPLMAEPTSGAGNVFDVRVATIEFKVSPINGDITDFASAQHPSANIFQTLDGNGLPIDITFGTAGQIRAIPEPKACQLGFIALLLISSVCRRRPYAR